jgi:Beta-ketoacyl synthase, N-terminal domain
VKSIQPSDFSGYFSITRWQAWTPGIKQAEDWQAWLSGELPPLPDEQPDVSYLPGLLRRRLDRFGRMALTTAWPCAQGLDAVRYVFASRHGALNRTVELLVALADNNLLSPTMFTLSVHNSVPGLFAIARGDRSPATAMAAGADTLGLSILEAASMIAESGAPVLLTYADDALPDPFRGLVSETGVRPFAISLLLAAASGEPARCHLEYQAHPSASEQSQEHSLIQFLSEEVDRIELGVHQKWRLERDHAV